MSELLTRYYAQGGERDRLTTARGQIEFERTKEIVLRHLPPAPSTVADIGGGAGPYTLWLAGRGHRVEHRDLMPLHVQQLRETAAPHPEIHTTESDAHNPTPQNVAQEGEAAAGHTQTHTSPRDGRSPIPLHTQQAETTT
ncbi:hypothetical protein E1293_45255, partial [Actinomadura darangshiensis]